MLLCCEAFSPRLPVLPLLDTHCRTELELQALAFLRTGQATSWTQVHVYADDLIPQFPTFHKKYERPLCLFVWRYATVESTWCACVMLRRRSVCVLQPVCVCPEHGLSAALSLHVARPAS